MRTLTTRSARCCALTSPSHVSDEICAVELIPYTRTGKKMEVPVRKILMRKSAEESASLDSMAVPNAIHFFVALAREHAQRLK